jgi:two-component system CheB/CheR fusion protein
MADDVSLQELVDILASERGLDLRGYKHSTLERRVRRRMFALNTGSFADYLQIFRGDPKEKNELLNTVLINVTEFFRDPQAWDALRDILPKFLRNLRPGDTFRAWSAGCASGEEPYSLAILLAEHFGPRLQEYDIKIYATDIDEDALTTARRGEYSAEHLRHISSEWRNKYFQETPTMMRISRDVRRLVIFGRSNLASDAPISHCHLVICRNVLIYFDNDAQRHIFSRLHYALEREGILFLGKAESKLTESRLFRPLNSRWRIFQRISENVRATSDMQEHPVTELPMPDENKLAQELRMLRLQQRFLLETLKPGVMMLDARDVVLSHNDAALSIWNLAGSTLIGKRIQSTEIVARCAELAGRLETSRAGGPETISFHCRIRLDSEERGLFVTLRAVKSETGERSGTIVYTEDITMQERLQTTVEQLEATGEELQSANEELETTNEELQSTNEELETTNEELQSTNEELETTNEELQSLNEELEHMNEELERRTSELNVLSERYAETLRRTPLPVLLVDKDEKIQLWNAAAQQLFGVGATSVVGVEVDRLPIEESFRKALVRRIRTVLTSKKATAIRNQSFAPDQSFDLHFTPISRDNVELDGVLIMFGPLNGPPRPGNGPKNATKK